MPFQFVKSIMITKLFALLMCVYSVESLKCQVQVIGSKDIVGCFIDTSNRLLPHKYVLEDGNNPPDMENNMCLLYCKEQGYMYSGTQDVKECWCGDDPYQNGPEDIVNVDYYMNDYDCNYPCIADPEQMCGGGWRLSVYKTGNVNEPHGQFKLKLVSNNTILTAPANQILISQSKIECALYCKISGNCKVFVISTETGQCSLYNSYTIMCEGVQHVQGFQVYMMK